MSNPVVAWLFFFLGVVFPILSLFFLAYGDHRSEARRCPPMDPERQRLLQEANKELDDYLRDLGLGDTVEATKPVLTSREQKEESYRVLFADMRERRKKEEAEQQAKLIEALRTPPPGSRGNKFHSELFLQGMKDVYEQQALEKKKSQEMTEQEMLKEVLRVHKERARQPKQRLRVNAALYDNSFTPEQIRKMSPEQYLAYRKRLVDGLG